MLILVGVTVTTAINGGLFDSARKAALGMNTAQIAERADMIKVTLIADLEEDDNKIFSVKQEYMNRLQSEFKGATIEGDKVIVEDGKYEINIKNTNLDIEVKDYVKELVISTNITREDKEENGKKCVSIITCSFKPNMSQEEYIAKRTEEIDKISIEDKRKKVLEDWSVSFGEEASSIDDMITKELNYYAGKEYANIEEWQNDTNLLEENGVESITKEDIYFYYCNSYIDESEKMTEEELIEVLYPSPDQEYREKTNNLTIEVLKDGETFDSKSNSSINNYSFITDKNGIYEIIVKNTKKEIITFEKIVINDFTINESEYCVPADGTWATNKKGKITKYLGEKTEVTIPMSVGTEYITILGNDNGSSVGPVFNKKLAKVKIPHSIINIEGYAFSNCTNLTEVIIPDSVTEMGESVFSDCTNLEKVQLSESITEIKMHAFKNCTSLNIVKIPNSVTKLGTGVFYMCTSLKEVQLPNSLIELPIDTFYGCSALTKITIPNTVTTISDFPFEAKGTFENCTSLTEITIPNSVKKIGNTAFKGCTSLTSITFEAGPNTVPEGFPWGATNATLIDLNKQ